MTKNRKQSVQLHKQIEEMRRSVGDKRRRVIRAGVSDDVAKFLASGGEVKQA